MKFDKAKAQDWLRGATASLPKIDEIIKKSPSNTLVIGAGVFDIYSGQGWTPEFKRKTGDLDLSIGLVNDTAGYEIARDALLEAGYQQTDRERQYRFYPQIKIPGALTYVDLLAHPVSGNISEEAARGVMGVGPSFSFAAMGFAMREAYEIVPRIFCPHPIALAALKLRAYIDEPIIRLKDLADVAEMVWGLVEKGSHFEIKELWEKIKNHDEALFVRKTLYTLGQGESAQWDLDAVRDELLDVRNFSDTDVDQIIPERIMELVENLLLP